MNDVGSSIERRRHRSTRNQLKMVMRGLRSGLSMLNQQVGSRISVKGPDLDCLDVIGERGPISPSALSRETGIHPATLTGILDRLESGRWVIRERDPESTDRRSIRVRAIPDRTRDLLAELAGMNAKVDRICADYSVEELELIIDFMRRVNEASTAATKDLSER